MRLGRILSLALLGAGLSAGGCSRLLPPRHGEAASPEIVLDTSRDPREALSGRFIPEVVPAYSEIPVFFPKDIPRDATVTEASVEVVNLKGAPLGTLRAVVEKNHVYLDFASAKAADVSEAHVVVRARYSYPW